MPFYGFKSEVLARLDRIIALQEALMKQGLREMATIDEVVAKVAEETTHIDGLKVFIQGLRDAIVAVPGITPEMQAKIDTVFAGVSANNQAISDAMVNVPVK